MILNRCRPPARHKFAAAALVLSLLIGCSATKPPLTAQQAQALEWNHQGAALLEKGNYKGAIPLFESALIFYRSTEEENGIAVNLLNLTQAYTGISDLEHANMALDSILLEKRLAFPLSFRTEAMLRKALLAAQLHHADSAMQWLDQADSLCNKNCEAAAKLYNLRARLYLDQQKIDEGMTSAELALQQSRRANDRTEEANALRLLGAGHIARSRLEQAHATLHEALAIDKALGASSKIYQDLWLLGHTQGPGSPMAMDYWMRARDVARATGDQLALKEIDDVLSKVNSTGTTDGNKR